MLYRELKKNEFDKFNEINRAETINQIYYYRKGKLELRNEIHEVPDLSSDQKQEFINSFHELHNNGGFLYAAFEDSKLVGMGTLDIRSIGSNKDQINLKGLWVSQRYRKRGVAKTLIEMVKQKANELGVRKLYVSATPSRNTVDFYLKRGFILAKELDKQLFELEPEDIHMELEF